jgi:Zn-dependent M16 (insulinase) family peptidase
MSFKLIQARAIPELNTTGKLFIHEQTGAQVLSLTNNDENKCFGINFRTPPADSTGIAHIMEHSVLCGSQKYPVKEPFVEILKGSLQTFINAFTYPDKTCYPCASQNLKDFYNLVDIYLDAVLHPLIPEHVLRQEGWHYEIESPEKPLTYKGVVFNEMKGAYSSPDDLLGDKSRSTLFPDNTYQFNAGGDPLSIPDLTYAAFTAFHEFYYHPSNAYIYFYGDDPEDERLRILETWLKDFDNKEVDSQIPLQAKFQKPLKLTFPYDSGDSNDAKAHLTLNWMLSEPTDVQTSLDLSILSHILLATPASPLKRTLIESGLGEDVVGGFEEQLRQTMFSAGLKGIQVENLDKVEDLILVTLTNLVQQGIDPQTIAASLNTVEFHLREQNTGRFPRGLSLMLGALTTWIYDGDPLDALAFEKPLNTLKEKAKGNRFFESLIEQYLLNNSHRTSVRLIPDSEEGKRRNALEAERLSRIKNGLSQEELSNFIALASELKLRQETPDSPEALATIPSLSLTDIDRNIRVLPSQIIKVEKSTLQFHDLFTNGIVYLDLGFDLHTLPQELLPYAGLLGRLLLEMGTDKEDFVKLTQRIGRDTGGIRSAVLNSSIRSSNRSAAWFFLRGKAIASQSLALLSILQDILLSVKLDQPDRFKQIVLERKAGLEAGLLPGGSGVVNQRLRAHLNQADWVSEQMQGISHLFFLRNLLETVEKDWASVLEKLEKIRFLLVNNHAMITNVTLDKQNFASFEPQLRAFMASLPNHQERDAAWDVPTNPGHEGLTIPAQVNYVGKGANIFKLGYKLHGSIQVIDNFLHNTWLWEKIRVQGGAYGGQCAFDINSGIFTFISYRDPNLLASLDIYDATSTYLRNIEIPDIELSKSIIGTIGDFDAYMLPDAKGWTSMIRNLTGYDDKQRQQFRDEVLSTSIKDFSNFGDILGEVARDGKIVVLGSADAIEKANKERPGLLAVKKVL